MSASTWAFIVAVLLFAALGGTAQHNARQQAELAQWVAHTYRVIDGLHRMLNGLAGAESAMRGFALKNDDRLWDRIEPAIAEAREAEAEVRELTRDNQQQQRRLDALEPLLLRRLEILRDTRERARPGTDPSTWITSEAIELSGRIRRMADEMARTEHILLERRQHLAAAGTRATLATIWATLIGSLMVGSAAFILMSRESRRRQRAEGEIQARHSEQALMLNLAELLQACRTLDESYDVVARMASQLFAPHSGSLYVLRSSRDLLEMRAKWGNAELWKRSEVFAPDDCWGLRRGHAHEVVRGSHAMFCKHMNEPRPECSLCLPLMAHGEVIGLVCLAAEQELDATMRRLAGVVAEQMGMALANIKLRETLRDQSIRDPLTGLFNRRYAEETLQRELCRSEREHTALAVLAIDVDHFKRMNDNFGHDAGDQVLKEVASLLRTSVRGGDVVSRMGGEELLVILPSSDLSQSLAKAEHLREAVAGLKLQHRGTALSQVTISIGVAAAREHGYVAENMLKAADEALYRAKSSGRNKVLAAHGEESPEGGRSGTRGEQASQ
ncbi:MAG: diguanylate cyclase [Myxococcota bacterium]